MSDCVEDMLVHVMNAGAELDCAGNGGVVPPFMRPDLFKLAELARFAARTPST